MTLPALTTDEKESLTVLEKTIKENLQAFYQVGAALMKIRDSKLYRESHGTFEEYCREKWGFTRMKASQFIAASEVMENVNNCLQKPATESQARPLSKLPPEEQKDAWGGRS